MHAYPSAMATQAVCPLSPAHLQPRNWALNHPKPRCLRKYTGIHSRNGPWESLIKLFPPSDLIMYTINNTKYVYEATLYHSLLEQERIIETIAGESHWDFAVGPPTILLGKVKVRMYPINPQLTVEGD